MHYYLESVLNSSNYAIYSIYLSGGTNGNNATLILDRCKQGVPRR
jgi:hypothetical protein